MNILYCGDRYVEDGMMISIFSLLKHVEEPLNVTVLSMDLTTPEKRFFPVAVHTINYLDRYVKAKDPRSSVQLIDVSELFQKEVPEINMGTRFTPYCMLRLYVDQLEDMPDRLLYLDGDVVCRMDIHDFYHQDMDGYELAGVLDHYGKWFFRNDIFRMDYINSGVLLLNLEEIRKTGLFTKCRERCRTKKMFMPDQSAINKLATKKKICDGRYNEQRRLHEDTVMQHFTTSFRFFPWIHTLTVKPWQIERVHRELKIFEYDDILEEYKKIKEDIEGEAI